MAIGEFQRPVGRLIADRLAELPERIQILAGPRQVGKTTLVDQLLNGASRPVASRTLLAAEPSPVSADAAVGWNRPLHIGADWLVVATDGDVMVAPISQRNFEALCDVTGLPALRQDPRFASLPSRAAHWTELMAVVEQWTCQRSVADCLKALDPAGVPCAHCAEPGDALHDPQLQARGLFAPVNDGAGSFIGVNAPWQMSAGGSALGARVPAVGEHSAQVLGEVLGLGADALAGLRAVGAFGAASRGDPVTAR